MYAHHYTKNDSTITFPSKMAQAVALQPLLILTFLIEVYTVLPNPFRQMPG
jgi:hypothetical protein